MPTYLCIDGDCNVQHLVSAMQLPIGHAGIATSYRPCRTNLANPNGPISIEDEGGKVNVVHVHQRLGNLIPWMVHAGWSAAWVGWSFVLCFTAPQTVRGSIKIFYFHESQRRVPVTRFFHTCGRMSAFSVFFQCTGTEMQ